MRLRDPPTDHISETGVFRPSADEQYGDSASFLVTYLVNQPVAHFGGPWLGAMASIEIIVTPPVETRTRLLPP